MARASSTISVAIVGDSRKLQGAVRGADKSVQGFGSSMKRAAVGIGGALVGLFAVNKAFEFIGDSLGEADRLGDSVSNLNRIIGEVNTKKIEDAADDFLKLGLSSADVLELSVAFARIGKAIGLKPRQIADYADDVAAVGQALSLIDEKGRGAADWVQIIAKAASKPATSTSKQLQALGITISEAGVIKQALKATGKTSADQLTKGELASARFLAIMRKLRKVVPDALMNPDVELKQAQLKARIEELQGKIGMGLMPIVADLLQSFLDISESQWVTDLMEGVDVVKAAIPPILTDLGEGWQLFLDNTGLAGADFGEFRADVEEDVQQLVDAFNDFNADVSEDIRQIMDFLGDLGDTLFDVSEGVYALGGTFLSMVATVLGPLGNLRDLLEDILKDLGVINGTPRTGHRDSKGQSSGQGDRSTTRSVERELVKNGLSTGMGIN